MSYVPCQFKVDTPDIKTAITFMLLCKRANIEYSINIECIGLVLHDAILQKQITPGEYKELFGENSIHDDHIIYINNITKTECLNERKKHEKNSSEHKRLTALAMKSVMEEERIHRFLDKASSTTPDSVCGCSSVSCLETHAE
jgi:hypothetical protein